jgi:hypothetical protein
MPARFRLTAPVVPELEIHFACADALNKLLMPPAEWACYAAGALELTGRQAARYAALGLKRSWPDLLIAYRGMWGIELKIHGGKLSKTRIGRTRRGSPKILIGQEDMFPRLLASGGFAGIAVAYSVEEMLAQLSTWGIPHRAATRGVGVE